MSLRRQENAVTKKMSCVLEDTSLEVLFLLVMLKADETFLANQLKP